MRFQAVLFAAAAAFLVSLPAHAESPGAAALRAWVAAIDASPKWAASFSSIDDRPGRVTLNGLSVRSEGKDETAAAVDIEKIAIVGYRSLKDGGFSASRFAIGPATAKVGAFGYQFAGLSLKGVAFPALGIALDPEHVFTSVAKIYTAASAIRIDSARLSGLHIAPSAAAPPQGTQAIGATYGDIWMSGLRDGRLRAISVGPVSGVGVDKEGSPVKFRLSGVEASALDFGAVARFLDPAAYADGIGDGVWHTAAGTVSYGEFSVEGKDTTVKLGRVLIRDMRVRQAAKPFAAAFDRLIANPDLPEAEAKALSADAGLDFLSGFALGRMSMQSIFVRGPDADDRVASVALKDFSVRDVSLAGIREISLKQLGVETAVSGDFTLDRFTLGGIAFPGVEVIRAAIADERAGRTPDPTTLVPEIALLEAAGAAFKFEDGPTSGLENARFDFARYIAGLPASAGADIRDLSIPAALIPEKDIRDALTGVGINALRLDFGYRADWLEEKQQVAVRDFRVSLKDIGEASIDLTVGGVTREMIAHRNDNMEALAAATFDDAKIVVKDRSFMDKLIRHFAAKDGQSPEDYRRQLIAGLPVFALVVATIDPELGTEATNAFKSYLQHPGTLTVTITPKQPLPLIQLMAMAKSSPEALPALLSIKIEATR